MHEMQTKQREETTVDLLRLAQALLKRAWLLVIVAIIFGVAMYIYSAYFITPTYQTSFTAYVNNRLTTEGEKTTSTADLNASISLANLYGEIITSRSVLLDAADSCGMTASYGDLKSMVTANVSEEAALITVYVEGTDPELVTAFAAGISEAAPMHVARVVEGSSMRIVDAPVMPTGKHSPNNTRNMMLGVIVGFVLAACVIVAAELINDKVQDAEDLESRYQLPVIGSIPDIARAEKSRGKYGYKYGYYRYGYKYAYKRAYRKEGKDTK